MKKRFNLLLCCCLSSIFIGCFNPNDYDDIKPDGIIWFEKSSQETIGADGVQTTGIKVHISNKAVPGKRTVTFKTDLGSFKNGMGDSVKVEVGDDFIATAYPVSVKAGTAKITAKISGIRASGDQQVIFNIAFPERISVSVDSIAISQNFNSEMVITASTSRTNGGRPTIGHSVDFSVMDDKGNQIGYYLNGISSTKTDSEGKAKVRFSAGNNTYTGKLNITVSTMSRDNKLLIGTTQVYLKQ